MEFHLLSFTGKIPSSLAKNPNAESWTKPAVTLVWYGRDAWGYSLRPSVTVTSNGWRAGKELYDHANDSEEVTNLAGYPENEELIASLSRQLKPFVTLKPSYRSK